MGIKEVAKLAGVSASTVSRIVNGKDLTAASPEKQERIWEAVRELRYVPNQHARSLKNSQNTNTPRQSFLNRDIDCIYARLAGDYLDPFFTSLLSAAEAEAFRVDYRMRYIYSAVDFPQDSLSKKNRDVESVIIFGRASSDILNIARKLYKNIVYSGLNEISADIDQILCSGYNASGQCVRHLASLGHSVICYLGETVNEQRFSGYLDAMSELGLPVSDAQIVETPFTPSSSYDAIYELINRKLDFTAVFCANDISAMGALKALRENRIKVPHDVSLIGINDMETVRYLDPMLTSIHIPQEEMGKIAAQILINRIEGRHKIPIKVELPTKLIVRESCAPVRTKKKRGGKAI
jgi:DNA-binding LacI/PurR family transcriptional regulator